MLFVCLGWIAERVCCGGGGGGVHIRKYVTRGVCFKEKSLS